MKKIFLLFVFIAAYSASNITSASEVRPRIKATEVYLPVGKSGQLISLMDLSQISAREYEKLSGKKMKFIDKVNFKIGQRELKKSINHDGTFSDKKLEKYFNKKLLGGAFSLSGFALGLFLCVVGVLIAYLITTGDKKGRIIWAWVGAIIALIAWGTLFI